MGSKCQHFRKRTFWEPENIKLAWSGRAQLNLVLAKVLRDPRLHLIWRIAKFWNISKLLQTEELARFGDLLIFPLQVPLVLDQRQVLLDRLLSDAQGSCLSTSATSPTSSSSSTLHGQAARLLANSTQVQTQVQAVRGQRVQSGGKKVFQVTIAMIIMMHLSEFQIDCDDFLALLTKQMTSTSFCLLLASAIPCYSVVQGCQDFTKEIRIEKKYKLCASFQKDTSFALRLTWLPLLGNEHFSAKWFDI